MKRVEDALHIVFEDDGVGFDPDVTARPPKEGGGLGLFSIRERTADFRGSLAISSAPGKGCKAILTVPLDGPQPARNQLASR